MREARNASGTITVQYFKRGETISGTSYFYTSDHLGPPYAIGKEILTVETDESTFKRVQSAGSLGVESER